MQLKELKIHKLTHSLPIISGGLGKVKKYLGAILTLRGFKRAVNIIRALRAPNDTLAQIQQPHGV